MITPFIIAVLLAAAAVLGWLLFVERDVSSSLIVKLEAQDRIHKSIEEGICREVKERYKQLETALKEVDRLTNVIKTSVNKPVKVTVTVIESTDEKYPAGTVFDSKCAALRAIGSKTHKHLPGRDVTIKVKGFTLKIN